MDYISQMEKLYKFLELNSSTEEKITLVHIKRKFNNDLNLFGCFIKDFLTIQNKGNIPEDENLYNDFVLFFENEEENTKMLKKIDSLSEHYLDITFEDFRKLEKLNSAELITAVSTVNSCFALDCYPHLLKLIDDFLNQKIDAITFSSVLKYLSDIVILRFEDPGKYDETFKRLWDEIGGNLPSKERLAG